MLKGTKKNREQHPQMESDLFAWICQKRDSDICVGLKMHTFLSTCQSKFMADGFNRDSLINMNHTSIYIDPEARTTYSEIGAKRVLATTAWSRASACVGNSWCHQT